jgi:hypothetical protein
MGNHALGVCHRVINRHHTPCIVAAIYNHFIVQIACYTRIKVKYFGPYGNVRIGRGECETLSLCTMFVVQRDGLQSRQVEFGSKPQTTVHFEGYAEK